MNPKVTDILSAIALDNPIDDEPKKFTMKGIIAAKMLNEDTTSHKSTIQHGMQLHDMVEQRPQKAVKKKYSENSRRASEKYTLKNAALYYKYVRSN